MQTGWKDRLEQWTPEPPAMVWERLSEQLEDKPLFAQKLHDFSSAPPAGAWQAIQKRMEPETVTTPVIRMLPRNKWVRYGSVAASLFFAFLFFRQYSQTGDQGRAPKVATPVQNAVVALPVAPPAEAPAPEVAFPGKPIAAIINPNTAQIPAPPVPDLVTDPIPQSQTARSAVARLNEVIPIHYNLEDGLVERYMVVPTGENAAVRLSKKLYDLFRCGEVPRPAGCSDLMARLRQRAASPALVTSADFAGVLEMVEYVD